jgi:23S rRNA-/tRNA-specific pseudouridylate synthase
MTEDVEETAISILWMDEHYAFLNKPEGVLIHRSLFSPDRDTLVKRLYHQFEKPPLPVWTVLFRESWRHPLLLRLLPCFRPNFGKD